MDDLGADEREKYAAVTAMIPLAEGKPAIHINRGERWVFVCRRVSGLHVALEECCFYGECGSVEPPEARPDELTDGMAISYLDACSSGPGWWYDAYFSWWISCTSRRWWPGRWRGTTPGCRRS